MKSTKNEAIIVGAGVAGLAAGVYLQSSGFQVTIIEGHTLPGGLSTSWKRKGYLFEGGMHWLTGSDPRLALNRVWHEVGALGENNPITNRDPIYTLVPPVVEGKDPLARLCLWRDLDKLQAEFDAVSPEDHANTARLVRHIRSFLPVHLVITDIPFLKSTRHARPPLTEYLGMTTAALYYNQLRTTNCRDYIARFKSPAIRNLLQVVNGYRYNTLSFIYTLASFCSGDCGYPKGGSSVMTRNMADKFTSLGGKIRYNTKVDRVIIENKKVKGVTLRPTASVTAASSDEKGGGSVIASGNEATSASTASSDEKGGTPVNGETISSPIVLVTQDTKAAVDSLFTEPLQEKWIPRLRHVSVEEDMFLCVGVNADLSSYPVAMVVPVDKPFQAGGNEYTELRVSRYGEGYAPEGQSVLTGILLDESYSWWLDAKKRGTYKAEKDALMERFLEAVERCIPEIKGHVVATDVATPLTYERYTGSYHGSWMSVWMPGEKPFSFPVAARTVGGLYFASERTIIPGGLPLTVYAARKAAQTICRDTGSTFVVPEV